MLIETNGTGFLQPGNVYVKKYIKMQRRKELLKNYINIDKSNSTLLDNGGVYKVPDKELGMFKFIELEVTPLCDFSQGKWLKSRILPGILFPDKYSREIKSSESFYAQIPLLKIDKQLFKPVFDFRLLKSCDIKKGKEDLGKPIFRIRRDICADILSRLSSHASRVGITYVE